MAKKIEGSPIDFISFCIGGVSVSCSFNSYPLGFWLKATPIAQKNETCSSSCFIKKSAVCYIFIEFSINSYVIKIIVVSRTKSGLKKEWN